MVDPVGFIMVDLDRDRLFGTAPALGILERVGGSCRGRRETERRMKGVSFDLQRKEEEGVCIE